MRELRVGLDAPRLLAQLADARAHVRLRSTREGGGLLPTCGKSEEGGGLFHTCTAESSEASWSSHSSVQRQSSEMSMRSCSTILGCAEWMHALMAWCSRMPGSCGGGVADANAEAEADGCTALPSSNGSGESSAPPTSAG